jgi:hypothetical protein
MRVASIYGNLVAATRRRRSPPLADTLDAPGKSTPQASAISVPWATMDFVV